MNSYQLCITATAEKFAAKNAYAIALACFTCSPPRSRSASGIVPLFPLTSGNCLSAPGSDTRSVAKARGGGYRRYS